MINKKILNALSGNTNSIPPVWLMRQAGRFLPEYRELRKTTGSFLDLCYSPENAAEATLQPVKRFGFDAAITFSDILVIPNAMGIDIQYQNGISLKKTNTEEDISNLDTKNITKNLSKVFEAQRIVKSNLDDKTTLIGFAGAPWTVATYMVEGGSSKDYVDTRKFAYENKNLFQKLIDILTDATVEYLSGQIEAGCEVVQIFDSWAGVLPEREFDKWILEPAKKITERIKKAYPDIRVIGFPKGVGIMYEKFAKESGVDGVSLDYTVPLEWIAKNIQPYVCVQGNLDPVLLATDKSGTIEEAKRIIDILGNGSFIFNLGHGVLPFTPIENVEALLKTIRH